MKPEKKKLFSGTLNQVFYLNAISISMKHKVGGGPGEVKTKGVTSHQSSPLSGLIDFLKRHQMSTSLWNYWFFDTAQQEIFICMQLRPRTNRWGLTSAEWQMETPPRSFHPSGPPGKRCSNSVLCFCEWVRRLCLNVSVALVLLASHGSRSIYEPQP